MQEKNENKKSIKISLKTAILIVVMVLAIIGLVAYIFIKENKAENTNTNIVKENKAENTNINIVKENKENEEVEKIEENSYAYKYFNEGLEVETLLPKNQTLRVTSIEKNSEGKFIITGNVYEECIISKETLEGLKNGKTINLYGKEYKYEYKKGVKPKDDIIIERDIEYEIEQLIPIDGGEGVYLINKVSKTVGEENGSKKLEREEIRLIYAPVEDWVIRLGSQEIVERILVEKKPIETISITVDNIKKYGEYIYSDYIDEGFYQEPIGHIETYIDSELDWNYYECYLNFIMKDGKAVEFWSNDIDND